MRTRRTMLTAAATLAFAFASLPRAAAQFSRKDYLSDTEADRVRDAATPGARMVVYVPSDEPTKDRLAQLDAGVEPPTGTLPCGHPVVHEPV